MIYYLEGIYDDIKRKKKKKNKKTLQDTEIKTHQTQKEDKEPKTLLERSSLDKFYSRYYKKLKIGS